MRYLVLGIVVMLLGITTPAVLETGGGHGCAPPVPPPITGSIAPAKIGLIVINEILLVPHSTWNCSEKGTYFPNNDVWLELYNPQNQAFNLYNSHFAIDSGPTTNSFYFPLGASIAAHGFLVVFPRTNAGFASTMTSTLRLIVNSTTIDQVNVPSLGPDQSYARTADGTASWYITPLPTIDASNSSLTLTPPPSTTTTQQGSGNYPGSTSTPAGPGNKIALVNGKQPQWHQLQLPTALPTAPITQNTPSSTLSSPSPATTSPLDLPRRIELTILALAIVLTLYWCWRRFKTA
ncbi:MAG: hypothetical protein ACJ8AG_17200 [Ktedonobacteraceae bacterium]